MKLTFFTNFINHHQVPVADELYKLLGEDYTFVANIPMPQEFIDNGYPDFSDKPYLLKAYENNVNFQKALELGLSSDVVIIGSASNDFIKKRLQLNKITFRYSERFLKKRFIGRGWYYLFKNHTLYRNKNMYMLCASAYTANDAHKILAYPDKCYKWGYFTTVNKIDIDTIISHKQNKSFKIIWVARIIAWKHPEMVIELAKELKKKGYQFEIEMIGDGVLKDVIQKEIDLNDLRQYVTLPGSLPNEQVVKKMQESNAFLFTSDRNEGWGAVLNEAMSNGCTAVASNMIGSVPFLIENNINGLIFKSGDLYSLINQVEKLILNRDFCNNLAKNAYMSMDEVWSPKNAASNFIKLAQSFIDKSTITIEMGPCSKAYPVKKNIK